ncbi:MAG TPA: alpha/beta hydrolase [Baekduia sp.]|uniref:alpha/beta fold hydrolase n=1 Tax=Baekduia sp. TaxID=2600305 RepID=UPI002D765202|nr:alpha/beta hydrolase [Baekduia sp.]HET6505465.1 alpha/beta hydrolase [Baekduia sp.]
MHEPLVEHRLTLDGVTTRALELEGDGPPLVLLHGFADSADTWRRALDLLGRRGRRALAVDLPGYGRADALKDGVPVLEQYRTFASAAVRHASEEAGGAPVVLAGNSLGGAVALRAGEDDGLPLAGIVPVAPAGLDMPGWFRVIERDPFVRALLAAPVPLPEALVRTVVGEVYRALAFAAPRAAAAEVVSSFTQHLRERDAVATVLANGRRLLPELTLEGFALADIAVPVLLIWGDRDRMVRHEGSRHVLDALPDTTYVLLDGVGHCPQVEAPERFVTELERFTMRHNS